MQAYFKFANFIKVNILNYQQTRVTHTKKNQETQRQDFLSFINQVSANRKQNKRNQNRREHKHTSSPKQVRSCFPLFITNYNTFYHFITYMYKKKLLWAQYICVSLQYINTYKYEDMRFKKEEKFIKLGSMITRKYKKEKKIYAKLRKTGVQQY